MQPTTAAVRPLDVDGTFMRQGLSILAVRVLVPRNSADDDSEFTNPHRSAHVGPAFQITQHWLCPRIGGLLDHALAQQMIRTA